ncbi:putative ATP-dependent RNA helicase DHR1 [Amphichorda felina]
MAKFVPRQRKHKVLARQKAQENARHHEIEEDTNQEILLTQRKKDLEVKKQQMKEKLRQEGTTTNASGKKAKRLEKYIDTKLRKDENRELLAKLASKKVDTSLFSSSRSLGTGRETKKQQLRRALREHKAGINADEETIYEPRREVGDDSASEDEDTDGVAEDEEDAVVETGSLPKGKQTPPEPEPPAPSAPALGSGLKRPLEVDDEGRPVIPKRQKRGGVKSKFSVVEIQAPALRKSEAEEWEGFSSDKDEDSADSISDSDDKSEAEDSSAEEDGNSADDSDSSDISSEGDDSEDEDAEGDNQKAPRLSGFKAWAQQQRNKALGFNPNETTTSNMEIPRPANFVPRAPEQEPLPRELQPTEGNDRKAFSVSVSRTPEIQEARLKLPVVSEEQRIMEAIHNHDIVVVCGATGSGKTTQVPQFLYEAGYGSPDSPTPGMIGITQPRRVAAVSMSKRVSTELGDHSDRVAYQIRFESSISAKTAIKFMTDGVLLREVAEDITLKKYSAIVIDEAHERSVNTDVLIGMLSRVIKLRTQLAQEDPKVKPLKLIIMSATLRIEDLTMNSRLFATPPPVLEVEGRQHPVTTHFSRRTTHDYVEEAFLKISRGHKKLPPGSFLVFLTGRNEIVQLSKRLKAAFGGLKTVEAPNVRIPASEVPVEVEDIEFGDVDDRNGDEFDEIPSDDDEDEDDEFQIEEDQEAAPLKAQVLPLYSLLPTSEQMRVFDPPPDGTRQIILATNVAETSLTIPGTRYVFDCGRSKERQYDSVTGVQTYEIGWISKASASQRSGRAGRTGPGHCYRLYSSAVYERDFAEFGEPEILRMPIEGVVLQLKSMNLPHVVNFPFPTPPDRRMLAKAEKALTYLSAISPSGGVTEEGKKMSIFPLAPRFSRILLMGHLHGCLPYAIAMVAGLSAAEVFLPENQAVPALATDTDTEIRTTADVIAEDRQANARRMFNEVHRRFCSLDDKSDAIKLLQVVGEFAHAPTEEWCKNHFVRYKVLKETQQLRKQITDIMRTNVPAFANLRFEEKLERPSPKQIAALKQMAALGFIDQVAIRADLTPNPPELYRKPKRPIDVPYMPLFPLPGQTDDTDRCVYIHPSSPMAHMSTQECPDYIVYSYLQRAAASVSNPEKKVKTRMHCLTDISGGQLAGLAKGTPLITYGKPVKEVKASRGADGALTRECWVVPYLRSENSGSQGWPLPMKKVKQKKLADKGWVVVD